MGRGRVRRRRGRVHAPLLNLSRDAWQHGVVTHDHSRPQAADPRSGQTRALSISLIANGVFMFVQFAAGFLFGSLALLADSAHMLSDVGALAIALAAHRLLRRPASDRHTYGLQRAEVLGAQANGILLLLAAAWIVFEATRRLREPQEIEGLGLLVVAFLGLSINVGSAVVLRRSQGNSLNMRGAVLHMALDAFGSAAALVAGLGVLLWNATWLDSTASFVIAVLILWSALHLLREATHVLLEGTPRGTEPAAVKEALTDDPDVESVHHLHLWNLASDVPALSAHVVVRSEPSLHEAQLHGNRLKEMLRDRFGIAHATLELECHPCEPVSAAPRDPAHPVEERRIPR